MSFNNDTQIVNELIRNLLIDLSLKTRNKELFNKMTSNYWENNMVCPKRAAEYVFVEKELYNDNERKASFLETQFIEHYNGQYKDINKYIKSTTITDCFNEKKKTVHQLNLLSKSANLQMHNFMKKIYKDEQLVNLLTITSDKKYRNSVFYMDKFKMKWSLKDNRPEVSQLPLDEALEYFKIHKEQFFIEVRMPKKTKNA